MESVKSWVQSRTVISGLVGFLGAVFLLSGIEVAEGEVQAIVEKIAEGVVAACTLGAMIYRIVAKDKVVIASPKKAVIMNRQGLKPCIAALLCTGLVACVPGTHKHPPVPDTLSQQFYQLNGRYITATQAAIAYAENCYAKAVTVRMGCEENVSVIQTLDKQAYHALETAHGAYQDGEIDRMKLSLTALDAGLSAIQKQLEESYVSQ